MSILKKLSFLGLPALLLCAVASAKEINTIELENPELEQTRIIPEEDEAQKALKSIEERVRIGDLPKVQFDFDSEKLRTESLPTLNAIADLMKRYPFKKLMINAHCCKIGSYNYNIKLSIRRAKSVRDYLIKRGVPPPSMRFHGKGYTEPIADNGTPEGRSRNRRVEFILFTRDWSSVY